MIPTLRDYQQEDFDAVLEMHKSHQCVLGRAATGLGKAVLIAALAKHYSQFGRVLVLVDVGKLVDQLAETIKWFTGIAPGVERAEQRANNGWGMMAGDQVIVSTIQTQYSGDEGRERYRKFNPNDFAAVLLDECETFFPDNRSRSVVEYYRQNEKLRVFGCTATPFRSDGVAAANLFTEVAFDRDILWGRDNGWLVRPKQGFVRVSLDFSTLKVRKGSNGEVDYSDEEIAQKLTDERVLIELAKGIIEVAGDRKSIVVCPTVATAQAVAHYLEAEKERIAQCIFGEKGETEKTEIFAAHKRGDFQFLTSVMMLTKGYDDPSIRAVFNCRKTKSKRLYTQILGRGVRPLKSILDGITDPQARIEAIAQSAKDDCLMVNMVGVDKSVRDITCLDILGKPDDVAVEEKAKELIETEGLDEDEAVAKAEELVEKTREQAILEAEAAAEVEDSIDTDRTMRRLIQVDAHVEAEFTEDFDVHGPARPMGNDQGISLKVKTGLRRFHFPDDEINKMSPKEAGATLGTLYKRAKEGLVTSWKQAKFLRSIGATSAELKTLKKSDVDVFIARKRAGRAA